MLIALDYDLTYTADADGWDAVIAMMRQRGHEFVCITGREQPPDVRERQIPMRVVCAGSEWKSRAAARAGLRVDVWIDDCPGMIEHTRILSFDDEAPNVRAKRATTAGRQARAGENVPRTARPGLVACRWRSA